MYPDVGGPFQSLQEAQSVIDGHLEDRRVPKMCMKQAKVSQVEMAIRTCLYFPDGTRKRCSKSAATEKSRDEKRRFVQALVDNHNNDHNLFGDTVYELKDVLQYYAICENHRVYYHFNFTAKTKGADDFDRGTDNLFFAEVKNMRQGEEHEELLVTCFCMVKPIDNGHCYGCKNHGRVNMKHPNEVNAFTGGHLDICMPMTLKTEWSDEEGVCDLFRAELRKPRRLG
ncbi:uncharacterized protein LOC100835952 isoform X2 [Brachypodium distachyon]|uniref:DUF3615 domain-containing protein n=1 Tax=Brachypodium distachyon TaxID=15368 RepID=A0A0Q3I0L0_BRADI|nr:uncharacterized protein LOC100835952 isoform X2 [Brachypodium distachyon]KQJ99386.1 hypothetical protein BRADI_3g42970v3 [Brachypodium distachyon]|eukprot:XP_010235410.1 uncharacterized protein LOC100835952 isoform X2 [Brachypodium distachyon]